MMKKWHLACALTCAFTLTFIHGADGQVTANMQPLTGFGGADGWLAPGENGYQFLGTGSLERGFAYSAVADHLYLVSRANVGGDAVHIRILDAYTGTDLGELDTSFTVAGGLFPLNSIGVAEDGAIYAANLTTNATTTDYRVYRWADEFSIADLVYAGGPAAARMGDSFDVIGSGDNTQIVVGFHNTPDPGANGFAIVRPNINPFLQEAKAFTVSGTLNGDYRLTTMFVDEDTVLGTAGSPGVRLTNFNYDAGTTTLVSTLFPNPSNTQRGMDFAVVNGIPLLATIDTATSLVRVYDATNLSSPVLLDSGNLTTGLVSSGGNSYVQWGAIGEESAVLYAMNVNNGIQAFVVTVVPEPSSAALVGIAIVALAGRRRRR